MLADEAAGDGGIAAAAGGGSKARVAALVAQQQALLRAGLRSAAPSRPPPRPAALLAAEVDKAPCAEAAAVVAGVELGGERLPWYEGPLLVKQGDMGWTWQYFVLQLSQRCAFLRTWLAAHWERRPVSARLVRASRRSRVSRHERRAFGWRAVAGSRGVAAGPARPWPCGACGLGCTTGVHAVAAAQTAGRAGRRVRSGLAPPF